MKIKIAIIFVAAMLGTAFVYGMPIDAETAIQRYEAFTGNEGLPHKLLETYIGLDNLPTAYVVTYNDDSGFIILSADDTMKPLLGYSPDGTFSKNLPEPLEDLIKCHGEVVKKSRSKPQYVIKKGVEEQYAAITPLITSTWTQATPYNDLIPNNYPTGCVATAMAQVMKYWNYPKRGYHSVSYVYNGYTYEMNLEEEEFDWDNMLSVYGSAYSDEQAHAVAYLMKACGYSVSMMYGPTGSGALPNYIPGAFKSYFGYDPEVTSFSRRQYSDAQWEKLLYENLRDYGPMVYSGYDSGGYGHTFVCDGYDGNGLFHYNWGWGYDNGYFDINNTKGYTERNSVTANIRPKAAEVKATGVSLNGISYESVPDFISLDDISYLDLKLDLSITTGLIDSYLFLTVEEEISDLAAEKGEIFKTIIPVHIAEGDQDFTIEKQIILPDIDYSKQYKVCLSYYGIRDTERVKALEFIVKQ